jgi:uncharacterized protein
MRVPRSLMGAIGADAIAAAVKASPLQDKYGQTVEQPPEPDATPKALPAPGEPGPDFPPLSTDFDLPPMPPPAEPKGPAVWEQVLKNPTVKNAINTGVREVVRNWFGTGRRRK